MKATEGIKKAAKWLQDLAKRLDTWSRTGAQGHILQILALIGAEEVWQKRRTIWGYFWNFLSLVLFAADKGLHPTLMAYGRAVRLLLPIGLFLIIESLVMIFCGIGQTSVFMTVVIGVIVALFVQYAFNYIFRTHTAAAPPNQQLGVTSSWRDRFGSLFDGLVRMVRWLVTRAAFTVAIAAFVWWAYGYVGNGNPAGVIVTMPFLIFLGLIFCIVTFPALYIAFLLAKAAKMVDAKDADDKPVTFLNTAAKPVLQATFFMIGTLLSLELFCIIGYLAPAAAYAVILAMLGLGIASITNPFMRKVLKSITTSNMVLSIGVTIILALVTAALPMQRENITQLVKNAVHARIAPALEYISVRSAGDVNYDGMTDKRDVELVEHFVVNGTQTELLPEDLRYADVNGTLTVDRLDVAFLTDAVATGNHMRLRQPQKYDGSFYIVGDFNGNGVFDWGDHSLMSQALAGDLTLLPMGNALYADANGDGQFTQADAVFCSRCLNGTGPTPRIIAIPSLSHAGSHVATASMLPSLGGAHAATLPAAVLSPITPRVIEFINGQPVNPMGHGGVEWRVKTLEIHEDSILCIITLQPQRDRKIMVHSSTRIVTDNGQEIPIAFYSGLNQFTHFRANTLYTLTFRFKLPAGAVDFRRCQLVIYDSPASSKVYRIDGIECPQHSNSYQSVAVL
ncbi:MAG: dockerin type I domain-containing protein [Patescibacteria group bacterium]